MIIFKYSGVFSEKPLDLLSKGESMCRFIAYKGETILLDDLLFRPNNSLIKQSYEAKELEEPLNGDGFGIGWYNHEISTSPAVFVSMTPAWSNRNLKNLAGHLKSPCIFAHVRAASMGDISEANCHPFTYENWMFMHNGGIEDFAKIKRQVRRAYSDSIYMWLRGQTDSEHFFALILDKIIGKKDSVSPLDVVAAMEEAIRYIQNLKKEAKVTAPTYLNTCITNGKFMVATRYCSDLSEEAPSLYYSTGSQYVCQDGVCHLVQSPDKHAAMVVSEKLTEFADDWQKVPNNHFVMIHNNMLAQLKAIE